MRQLCSLHVHMHHTLASGGSSLVRRVPYLLYLLSTVAIHKYSAKRENRGGARDSRLSWPPVQYWPGLQKKGAQALLSSRSRATLLLRSRAECRRRRAVTRAEALGQRSREEQAHTSRRTC